MDAPGRPSAVERRHLVLFALAVALLLALGLVGLVSTRCSSSREADVRHARVSPAGTRIVLVLGSCHADLSSRLVETEREVRVLVTARNDTSDDCADGYEIILSEPLGARLLIDESDDEPVIVERDESVPDAR